MSARTYAVIGSNCFTGSHIVDLLLQKAENEVVGISRSQEKSGVFLPYKWHPVAGRFQFHQVDLVRESDRLIELLDDLKPAYVINVAALSEVGLSNSQPVEYFETNTMGVVKLCNQLRSRGYLKRYVHVSSAEVYGSCAHPLKEEAPLNPSTPYAASKAAADFYLLTLWRNFGFPMNLVRSTNVYGRGQQLFKIIPRTVIYLTKGQKIELHGGGKAVKTWIHIRDAAKAVQAVLERGKPGEIYHFSDENSCTITDLVRRICQEMETVFDACTTSVPERLGQDAKYVLDYSKARRQLGWRPEVPFEEGIREVIDWVRENWEDMADEPLLYVHKV